MSKIKEARPKQMTKCLGIYLGEQRLTKQTVDILPLYEFVDLLWKDKLF